MKNFIEVGTSEEEQAQQIKNWLKNNIVFIIVGIAVGFGGVYGWDYYKTLQHQKNVDARIQYQSIVNKNEGYDLALNELSEHTEYKNQGLFLDAKYELNNLEHSISILENIQSNSFINDVKNIKLAQLYLEQKNYDKAINSLENNSLTTTKLHLLGDIYKAQNKLSLAKETYAEALKTSSNEQIRAILNIKINSIN